MPTLVIPPPMAAEVPYDERPDSPREFVTGGAFKVQRTFQVPWVLRWNFCMGMLGFPYLDPSVDGSYVVRRSVPIGYRTTTLNFQGNGNRPWIYPVSVDQVQPVGRIVGYDQDDFYNEAVARYELAWVTISYEALTYAVRSDERMIEEGFYRVPLGVEAVPDEALLGRFVTKHFQPTAEYLTLPFGALKWVDSGTNSVPVTGSHGKIVAAREVMIQWHQVPGIPDATNTHIGSVNDATWPPYAPAQSNYLTQFQRGTLLLTSIDIKPYRWFVGQRLYDITYKFKYFQPQSGADAKSDADNPPQQVNEFFGHNHFLRFAPGAPDTRLPEYYMLTHNGKRPSPPGNGQAVYPYKDFRDLFRITRGMEFI